MGMTSGGIIYRDPADVPQRQDLQTLAETAQSAITAADYAKLVSVETQSIPNTTQTQIVYGGIEESHPGSFAGTDQLTAPSDGIYQIAMTGRFDGSSTGTVFCAVRVTGSAGTSNVLTTRPPFSGGNCSATISGLVRLAAGDAVFVRVFQNSGGSVDATTTDGGNTLAAFRVRD